MGCECFQVSLCKRKTWRRKTFNPYSCVYVYWHQVFFAVDWRWICVYQMRFRSVCSAWWSADLTAGSNHLFSWTKGWDLKFCDLNYEDVHCIQIFMTAKDYIVFAYAHFFFLHWLKRWYAIRFVCLEYFIFRYCFLTHVAVHISFPLFKL